MADTPEIQSKEQIFGDLIDSIRARLRKDIDLNDGSVLTQTLEAITQGLFKASAAQIAMIDASSVDRASGDALQRKAKDANVPIYPAFSAYGQVNISDTSFQKIATNIYAGQPASVAGSTVIYVADASKFPATGGKLYIGRGTSNVEGPLTYTSTAAIAGGSYWSITLSPTSPTTKFHNIGETVVLGQGGNRFLQAGQTVQTPQGASITAVSFSTTSGATIIDGEVTVTNVPVICNQPGTVGNVSVGAIQELVNAPFQGTVSNPLGFNTGTDADTDDDIKARIKAYELAKSKGTPQAIEAASNGVVAKDELKKVASTNYITYSDNSAALVFDDGTGYEPNFLGAAFETVIASALGGEKEAQLRQVPVAQARVTSSLSVPFLMADGVALAVIVDGKETIHVFSASDFQVPSSATAIEIAASINGDPNLNWSASTANNETQVVLYPRSKTSSNIQVTVPSVNIDANLALGFGLAQATTLGLFKNDSPLYEEGLFATVATRAQSSWSPAITSGVTLIYEVDGTPAVTATITDANFQAFDVAATCSSTTDINTWAKVFNALMPGVIASVQDNVINFTSARGASSDASITISGGTLLSQIFSPTSILTATGQTSDYSLNVWTGQIGFSSALAKGDKITAGSQYTRGNSLTVALPSGPGTSGNVWLVSDGAAIPLANGFSANTTVTFTKVGTQLTIAAYNPSFPTNIGAGFTTAQPGDWIIVWANPSDPAVLQSNSGFWRVRSVSLTPTLNSIVVDDGATARTNGSLVPAPSRIVLVRASAPVQQLSFTVPGSGLSLVSFLDIINSTLVGVTADIEGSSIRISTSTFDADGQIFFAAADQGGSTLGLEIGTALQNVPAYYGYSASTDAEAGVPSFTHSALGAAVTDRIFNVSDYEAMGGSAGDFLQILNQYSTGPLTLIPDSNIGQRSLDVQWNPANTQLTMMPPLYMDSPESTMAQGDRFFLRSSYKFDSNDSSNVIVDNNSQTNSFLLPISRPLVVSSASTPTSQHFSATDGGSTLALSDPSSFYNFDFSNFKLHRQARTVLTDGTYSLTVKNFDYGPQGNRVRVGIAYPPTVNNSQISSTFATSDVVDALIYLPVATVRTPNWDYTTSFTVSKTTTGGADFLTFTARAGTMPNFTGTPSVTVGDIAFISPTAGFLLADDNIQAKVTAVTATTFTVKLPTGAYVSDALTFTNMVNQSGTITVTTSAPHNLYTGQRIGFYNTASDDGGVTYPFNKTYTATVTGASTFTVPTPVGTPGASIVGWQSVSNVVTVVSSGPHGLIVGDVVLMSGTGTVDGIAPVSSIVSPNVFTFIRGVSNSSGSSGRFDFQSFLSTTPVSTISTISSTAGLVTVNTAASHGLTPGEVVSISGVTIAAWSSATTYALNQVVLFGGNKYISLQAGNVNQNPVSQPTWWAPTTLDFSGSFIVQATPSGTQFTYYYQGLGLESGTGGTAVPLVPTGALARAIGGSTNENLQFGQVTTTAQQIADYAATSLANQLAITVNGSGSAVVDKSTADVAIASNYISVSVSSFHTFLSSRRAKVQFSSNLPAGSTVTITGMTGPSAAFNGTYVLLNTYLDTRLGYTVSDIQLPVPASATGDYTPGGAATGSTPMQMMYDGENDVLTSNIQALPGLPMFTAKQAWVSAPAIGEQVRLVATTSAQIVGFWNNLVVSGFSNVGNIELARYGREIQLSTDTFGGLGAVQVTGGTANSLSVAISGAGGQVGTKLGQFNIPYSLRQGFVPNMWINLKNTVTQNKNIQIGPATQITMNPTHAVISGGPGTFQTVRTKTHDATTQLKIENHGDFLAVYGIGGSSMSLITNGIQEGDWVRFTNTSTFNAANVGVFQVIRIFGQDTFWIQNVNAVEQLTQLNSAADLTFYDYESVMPGDVLVITTAAFGPLNVGHYTVVDDNYGGGYYFPTSSVIYFAPTITNSIVSPVTLGGEYTQFNVQEKTPVSLWKKVFAVGPAAGSYQNIMVDSPNLVTKITNSLGGVAIGTGKLNFATTVNYGKDAYKYYVGLIEELTKVIYGSPADEINYPGVRAGGTDIGITPAILRRIKGSFGVRINSGVPFTEIIARVQAAIAGYVNNLDVGESVSISGMIAAATTIPGVISVVVTYPTYAAGSDQIAVAANEKAFVVNPTTDLTVSLVT
jgi:hypothetical protein